MKFFIVVEDIKDGKHSIQSEMGETAVIHVHVDLHKKSDSWTIWIERSADNLTAGYMQISKGKSRFQAEEIEITLNLFL